MEKTTTRNRNHARRAARPRARRLLWIATWIALGDAAGARAYSSPEGFTEEAGLGGGGGRWFSGSPAEGYGCSVCHTAAAGERRFPLQVAGLPASGYQRSERYEIVLAWPEFTRRWRELRPDPMQLARADSPNPSSGLVAELVAESGRGSGLVELEVASAEPAEQCETVRANLAPRLGVKLFQVRPGLPAVAQQPGEDGVLRCEAHQLGQRCLVALLPCGAQQVRVRWTAPPRWEGPIWFSAGFVASEALSSTPQGDSVFELSLPVAQADAPAVTYESSLRSGCSVRPGRPRTQAPRGLVFLVAGLLGAACWRRRRTARIAPVFSAQGSRAKRSGRRKLEAELLMLMAAGSGSLMGCALDALQETPAQHPLAGLYAPGNRLGASDPTDMPAQEDLGDRCQPFVTPEVAARQSATPGTLQIAYTTQPLSGLYSPKNCSAAWIESADGRYVATLEVSARLRRPALVYFQEHACPGRWGADVLASATRADHSQAHELRWGAQDFTGQLVPDGAYRLFVEVTETDKEPGYLESFAFEKSPAEFDAPQLVAADGQLLSLDVSWNPEVMGGSVAR